MNVKPMDTNTKKANLMKSKVEKSTPLAPIRYKEPN